MPNLNVRLSRADAEHARRLRERGGSISELVRKALRAEVSRSDGPLDAAKLLAEMDRRFPAPKGHGRGRRPDASDRRSLADGVRRRLRRAR